tara:strand:+ start:826510 stop:826758 length:249 start_codon:yes stop_codon:yes gene_type:complete
VGIEPTLPKELDFESSASTNSATKAFSSAFCFLLIRNPEARLPSDNYRNRHQGKNGLQNYKIFLYPSQKNNKIYPLATQINF